MNKIEYTLSPAIEGKFEVVNTHLPIIIHPKLGSVDFRTITEEKADELVKVGTRYLVKVEKSLKKNSKEESAG